MLDRDISFLDEVNEDFNFDQLDFKRSFLQADLYEFIKYFWDTFDSAIMKDLWLNEFQAECFMYSVREFLPQWITKDWISNDDYYMLKLETDGECPIRDIYTNNHNWNMPPRHMKSIIHNVCGPVWLMSIIQKEIASISHKETLATEMNMKRQKIIVSDKFKEMFGDDKNLEVIKNSSTNISFKGGGKLFSVNMGGILGFGADVLINDDIVPAQAARKDKEVLINAKDYYRNTMPTRRNQGDASIIWNIQQRIAPGDISGMIESDEDLNESYTKTVIQAIAEEDKTYIFPCSGKIKKIKKGDFLWPERYGDYSSMKRNVGTGTFETQFQQNPINSEQTIIKPYMIKWIKKSKFKADYLDHNARHYASFDFPVKGKDDSDKTGMVEAYNRGAKTAIKSSFLEKMGYPEQKKYVTNLQISKPGIIQIYEDKANGSVLVQDLEYEVPGIVAFQPGTNSKEQRLDIASDYFNAENIEFVLEVDEDGKDVIPKDLDSLVKQLTNYPFVDYDDDVDATSQLVLYLYTDRELKIYGKQFDFNNVIDSYVYKNMSVDLCINRNGNVWKLNEIVQNYGRDEIVVVNEYMYKGVDSEIIPKILEHARNKRMIFDGGKDVYNLLMGKIPVQPNNYKMMETFKSVRTGFSKNKVLIMSHCKNTIADIETLRYTKASYDKGDPKPSTSNDGFAGNLRVHITYNKGKNAVFY